MYSESKQNDLLTRNKLCATTNASDLVIHLFAPIVHCHVRTAHATRRPLPISFVLQLNQSSFFKSYCGSGCGCRWPNLCRSSAFTGGDANIRNIPGTDHVNQM